MGSFANSVFSVLLGWVRSAVSWLWTLLTDAENGGLLAWLAANWRALAIFICVGGMAIDLIVYLARWQPYKVWASFFRRLRGRGRAEEEEEAEPRPVRRAEVSREPRRPAPVAGVRREWVYPDGTARTEVVPEEQAEDGPSDALPAGDAVGPYQAEDAAPSAAVTPDEYRLRFARPAQSGAPYASPPAHLQYEDERPRIAAPGQVRGLEDYPQPRPPAPEPAPAPRPAPEALPAPVERTAKRIAPRLPLARSLFGGDEDDELQLRYQPAPPAMDKKQAYRDPVYPPAWKRPAPRENRREGDKP